MNTQPQSFDECLAWALDVALLEPMEPPLYEIEECMVFLQNWIGACENAPALIEALGSAADQFVKVSQYALRDVVWREDLPFALCERAVTGSLAMLLALCERTGQTLVTGMFWMVVVECWDVILRKNAAHRLLPAVKSTLLEQVRLARDVPCLRDSAWEGIRLIDAQVAAEAHAIEAAMRRDDDQP